MYIIEGISLESIGAWASAGLLRMRPPCGEVANLAVVGEDGFPFGGILFFVSNRLEPMNFEMGVAFALNYAFLGDSSRKLPFRISS